MRARYQKNFGVDVGVQQIENVDICSRVHYFATIGNRICFVANVSVSIRGKYHALDVGVWPGSREFKLISGFRWLVHILIDYLDYIRCSVSAATCKYKQTIA